MNDIEITCIDCGKTFIFSVDEQSWYKARGFDRPKRCKDCRNKKKELHKQEQERSDNERWLKNKAEDDTFFEEKLKSYKTTVPMGIELDPNKTLYIIGNGFDIMHGVPSGYRHFEKTIGKNSPLRFALETYLNVDDLWADFEEALGHLNVSMMLDSNIIDMWLDDFSAYDPDAQAADFFAAMENATMPAQEITNELPRRFRMWVESLKCDTDKRPLKGLIQNGKVLCFNYTEFIEKLYGAEEKNICYIHGCRRKKKYHPKEELILGHQPGIEDEEWDKVHVKTLGFKDSYKRYMFDAGFDAASRNIVWYDDAMTKKSPEIIKAHQEFFNSLADVENVVVVGHSLSPVDWDYFKEVINKASVLKWFIGCHSLRDLESLGRFIGAMEIRDVTVIRT